MPTKKSGMSFREIRNFYLNEGAIEVSSEAIEETRIQINKLLKKVASDSVRSIFLQGRTRVERKHVIDVFSRYIPGLKEE